ncbi:MAG: methylmalonyl-CoA mutase, partial [Planctomycetes bacterium]|nr:methylmalonyl-CoA mutase [Planctomycetota bacterium]
MPPSDSQSARDAWESQVGDAASRATSSGIPLDLLYDESKSGADLGYPGTYPFLRGIYPTGYRGRLWTMRQYAGFSTAAETNRRFHYLLEAGQTGLSCAFDLPTQIGYDPD